MKTDLLIQRLMRSLQCSIIGLLVLGSTPLKTSAQTTDAYFARLMLGDRDSQVIERGVLVVRDGKILAAGEEGKVEVPVDAIKHQLKNMTILPGLVIAQTGLVDRRDISETLSPQVHAVDGFDFLTDRSKLLSAGITTVQISPGGNRLLPGVTGVVKLAGGQDLESLDARILSKHESLRIVLDGSSRNPPTIYEPPVGPVSVDRPLEPTRPQISTTLSGSLIGLRLLFQNATADRTFVSIERDELVDAVSDYLQKSKVVRVTAKTEAEIRGALDLARDFGLELILVDSTAPRIAELIQARSEQQTLPNIRGFVFSTNKPGTINNLTREAIEEYAKYKLAIAELIKLGHAVAFTATSDNDLADVLYSVGELGSSVRNIGFLASDAAKILGIEDRVGSLTEGKDADFVVCHGEPFGLRSTVMMTYINGKKVFDRKAPQRATLIRANKIYTGNGEVLENSALVVQGTTIRGMAANVSAPLEAAEFDFGNAVIVPGFIDLGCGLGVGAPLTGNIGLNTKLGEQLYPDDPSIKLARENGVTTVLLGSMSTTQPTPLVAYKLGDDPRVIKDPAAIRFVIGANAVTSVASIKTQLTRGKQYADSWIKYKQDLKEYELKKAELEKQAAEAAKAAKDEKEADDKVEEESRDSESEKSTEPNANQTGRPGGRGTGGRTPPGRGDAPTESDKPAENADKEQVTDESGNSKPESKPDDKGDKEKQDSQTDGAKPDAAKLEPPKQPTERAELEPYRSLFAGEIPAFVEARDPEAIEAAVKLFREDFDVRTVITGADAFARFPELLADKQVSVCAGPNLVFDLTTPQQPDQRVNLAQMLANEQIRFGFQSKAASGVALLPAAVRFAVYQGLGPEDGLTAFTKSSAEMLSSDLSFGTLAAGNDADLVVLSGPPFELSTEVLAVMIDGNWVYIREDQ